MHSELLSPSTVDLLRAAVRALPQTAAPPSEEGASDGSVGARADAETPSNPELRRALTAMCVDARARALRPEQLLIALKETWPTLPEVRALPAGEPRTALLSRVIGLCLDEYYRREP